MQQVSAHAKNNKKQKQEQHLMVPDQFLPSFTYIGKHLKKQKKPKKKQGG